MSTPNAAVSLDEILEKTLPRTASAKRPTPPGPIELAARMGWFSEWARSQVAAYRIGLILTYLGTIYFGGSALTAGVPVFVVTAPEGWTLIWAPVVVLGGFIASVGAIRAGTEPVTKPIRAFNWIELVGSTMLFLTLFTYAGALLFLGYVYGDNGRVAVGAGFIALGIHPAVRMIWLTFRPRMRPKARWTDRNPKLES